MDNSKRFEETPLGRITASLHDDEVAEALVDDFLSHVEMSGIDRESLLMHLWLRETEERLQLLPRKLRHQFCARLLIRFFVCGEESE